MPFEHFGLRTMSKPNIELTRRRVLGGILSVGAAGAAGGAGTMALFSDTEASTNNTVQAGTLDLTLDGSSQTVTFLDQRGVTPGDQGQTSLTLGNAGSVPGVPEIEVAAIRSTENGYYGKENGQDGSPNDGELDEHLEARLSIDGTVVMPRTTVDVVSVGQSYTASSAIQGGGSMTLTLEWWLPADTSNMAQSDGFAFDLTIRLTQEGGG